MRSLGIKEIWAWDKGYAQVADIERLEPTLEDDPAEAA
jgi:hypothetical protein